MAVTCDACTTEITEAPLIVPRMPSGISRYHARGQCAIKAGLVVGHTWPARLRARKIREAAHGPRPPVS